MKKDNLLIIIILGCILIPGILAIPQTLSLQGKLTDSGGGILSGVYNMTFKIYNSSTGGNSLWAYANQTITVGSDGIYYFILKDVNLTFAEQYYLGIAVGSDSEMTPRINLTSAPYAFRAQNITLSGVEIDSNLNLTNYNLTANRADFNGGWLSNGLSIIGGDIYAQVGYFYNITSLNVTRQNLTILDDFYSLGNAFLSKNLTVDTNTLFVDATNNRVGIGTGNPSQKLHVNGSANITANLSLGGGTIKYNDAINNYQYYNGTEWLTFNVLSSIPAGTIAAFNNETCPEGWIPANGSSGTPDLRGIFIRGAGISGVLTMANGTNFSATYGEYQNDSMQGHYHNQASSIIDQSAGIYNWAGGGAGGAPNANSITSPKTDGSSGTPRTGAETRPASYALTYCMKTSDDSPTTAGLIGSSGDNVFVQDASKNFGIGTTSPTEKLTVSGNITVTSDNDICITGGNCLSSPGGVSPGGTEGAVQFYDGGNFGGNSSQFSINKTSGNVSIGTNLNVTGNVTAGSFIGDGSQLTGITGGIWSNVSGVATYNGTVNITGNLSLGNSTIRYNESANKYIYYNGSEWVEFGTGSGAGQVPAGTISSFYLSSCPNGWILADGNSSTPDLRGIFVRGAGTSGSYKMANGSYYSATYGTYQNDSFQGHYHNDYTTANTGSESGYYATGSSTGRSDYQDPATGEHGTVRHGDETRPANLALIYCMKTADDSQETAGLIGSSGDNVFVQNISKNVGIGTITPQNKLNVVGDANVTGNVTADYFIGDGSQLTNLNISSDAYYRVYDTGWISRSDWTNVHLGSDTTKDADSDVTHSFNAPLSNLTVKVLISTDGTDANSFEIIDGNWYGLGTGSYEMGIFAYAVDDNNLIIQTGTHGIRRINSVGAGEIIATNDWFYKIKVSQIIRLNTTPLFGGTPANAIMSFNQAECPNGWILADGNSSTPDLRGIFVRGAGTSGSYKMANENYYSATYGTYQNDSVQGHWHNLLGNTVGAGTAHEGASGQRPADNWQGYTRGLIADGVNGFPRAGAETRPASYALIYCMKTTEDTTTTTALFQESGGIISTINSSHEVDVNIRSYDTGWVSNNDWTNQHLGTSVGGNVIHNLDAPLSDVLVKVLISTDGTDANSFETDSMLYNSASLGLLRGGVSIFQVDNNNLVVQTGADGVARVRNSDGALVLFSTDNWYYKIKVWKLG